MLRFCSRFCMKQVCPVPVCCDTQNLGSVSAPVARSILNFYEDSLIIQTQKPLKQLHFNIQHLYRLFPIEVSNSIKTIHFCRSPFQLHLLSFMQNIFKGQYKGQTQYTPCLQSVHEILFIRTPKRGVLKKRTKNKTKEQQNLSYIWLQALYTHCIHVTNVQFMCTNSKGLLTVNQTHQLHV